MEIFDEGRAAISTHRQEFLAERDIVSQLQEHLAEAQAQVDDWSFWYDQEYVGEYDMVQEDQEEGETAEVNQVQPLIAAPQQPESTPITPPVLQGQVPAELMPPAQLPSLVMTPLPPVQPSTTEAPPPPPPGPPPSKESPQSVMQQPQQPEPSVPAQQSLPSTHRCPDVQGIVSPMTQEYVPGRAPPPPVTPSACLQQDMTRAPMAPTSPPMRAELINSVLPEKVTSMAMQKGALKVPELLFLAFQTFLPSEPSARVDGLNTVESPLKAAKNFAEALSTLRTWRQQVVTVVTDLKANPEPLKLFNSLRILISNITSSDNAFATEVSQMYRSTQIKTSCTDRALMEFMNLLEIEMSHRGMEDDEDRRRRGQANMAASSSQSPPNVADAAANAVAKGGKKGKGKTKSGGKGEKRTVCQEYLTDKGCPKGDQCPHAHPRKAGKCLRCGATGHDLASCRRPAKDPKTKGSPPPPKGQGRGKGKAKAKPKPKAKAQAHESTAQPAGANAAWALEEDAGYGDAYDELNYVTSASACSFYTTFLPTFHAASTQDNSMEDHPENLQILDTGATHCLLPITWLGAEECEKAKRIHLKVATGTTVRAKECHSSPHQCWSTQRHA